MGKWKKAVLSGTIATGMMMAPLAVYQAPVTALAASQAFDNKIVKKIDAETIYQHVSELSVGIGERVAGTAAEKKAVDYIAAQYRSYGLDVDIQPFEFRTYQEAKEVSAQVAGHPEQNLKPTAFKYSPSTPDEGLTGEIVFAGLGQASDFAGKDVAGKIVLVERGTLTFAEKAANAVAAGAKALLIYNDRDGILQSSIPSSGSFVPTLGLTKAEGKQLKSLLGEKESVTATVKVLGAGFVTKTSYNVIATKKAHKNHDTGQILYVGSHHDSVPGSPGASDNASGVAVNLEIARVLSDQQTDTEIRFLTFGAEELGLLGSYHYVSTLTEEEKDRSIGMFNFDMVGSKNAGEMIMFTVDGQRNVVTNTGASASTRVYKELTYGKVGRSDHQPFHDSGIPSAAFSYAPLEPEYHKPTDTIDHISKEKMENMAKVVSAGIYQIARKDTPALERSKVAPKPVEPPFEDRPL
ncbi:M28 family peptidase [Bacillus sp. FJAT-27231]|uniref:M28 family peptidase n=1 Tax=Bacillus sp. FJAT-27231 TaxID=1679168 RepID=UPI0009E32754|nr:M28 family peptidase [Bacillus sp. FJAT-27231]